ncbi:hypothetical protein WH47_09244 [Habropoda laboriosa]|uniref:Uncharacterized protein n=1 Tax=Habropoda laboriosa TaxID=597456 RepID=A0A0L7R8X4_9HYME|nr:hypothetical protein WH47_09244 [Habropoda laboriosa]
MAAKPEGESGTAAGRKFSAAMQPYEQTVLAIKETNGRRCIHKTLGQQKHF